ncbi:hypothetical protein BSKO_00682 [Bryopsis sp. KO-2023]|nr:hypothetical protein BSKO_00682 [Bryopsis sp. KO-2023]
MYRPPTVAGYQGPQQTTQAPYQQSFASAPPVVAQNTTIRTWDGAILKCCGDCDGSGWATCLIGTFFPCILYGKVRERGFGQSCFCWGLLFFFLMVLFRVGVMIWSGREVGYGGYDGFDGYDGYDEPTEATFDEFYRFPRYIKTITLIFLGLALVLLGASTRSALRRRFGLPGSECKDFWLWVFCPVCSLCQEVRTLEKNNVNGGEWFGQTRYLPVLTQPPTPQAHTPQAHTPPPQRPPQSHVYGYHNQYQPPVYQHAGYQHHVSTPTSANSPAPSAPPATGIPFLEAECQAPTV